MSAATYPTQAAATEKAGELDPAMMGYFIPEGDFFVAVSIIGVGLGACAVALILATRRLRNRIR